MNIVVEVAKELLGMFLADGRLSVATLMLVILVAGVMFVLGAGSAIGGGMLLFGCLTILVEAAVREAKRRRS